MLDLLCAGVGGEFDREGQHDARVDLGPHAPHCVWFAAPQGGARRLGAARRRLDAAALLQLRINGLRRVVPHGLCRLPVKQLARSGEQQLQMVVQLRHRAHRGAAGAHGVGLVDGNGRGHALDLVHGRFVHAVQKLARIGAEGFHVAALAFGIQRVKNQARLARATGARDHREFTGADVQIQVLEVVLACAADSDQSLGHGSSLSGVRRNILGTNRGGRATRRSIPGTAVVLMLHCRIPQGTVTVKRWP